MRAVERAAAKQRKQKLSHRSKDDERQNISNWTLTIKASVKPKLN